MVTVNKLVKLMQYLNFKEQGNVYFELINIKRWCGFLDGELCI